jgi:hypothetical protein
MDSRVNPDGLFEGMDSYSLYSLSRFDNSDQLSDVAFNSTSEIQNSAAGSSGLWDVVPPPARSISHRRPTSISFDLSFDAEPAGVSEQSFHTSLNDDTQQSISSVDGLYQGVMTVASDLPKESGTKQRYISYATVLNVLEGDA